MKVEDKCIDDSICRMIKKADAAVAATLGIQSQANICPRTNGHAAVPTDDPDERQAPPESAATQDDRRRRIQVNNRPLHEVTIDALKALRSAGTTLYFRSGELVRVSCDETGKPGIFIIDEDELRGELARSAVYFRSKYSKSQGYTETEGSPPMDVVRDIKARNIAGMQRDLQLPDGELPFPALTGVTESPILRSDGTILTKPGYDKQSGVLYIQDPGGGPHNIPDDPTTDDRMEARDQILELIWDFPFANQASRANAIAFMLTPPTRRKIKGHVPLATFEAPQSGTGKTLLTDVMAMAATGRRPSMRAAPRDEEEWSKTLCSTLAGGTTMAVFDNIDHKLNSSTLALMITADEYEARKLGVNTESLRYPNLCTWAVTGNNIQLGGDLPRRCYQIRLDAKMSQPWKRKPTDFKHPDLLEWATKNSVKLHSALMTLVRGWFVGGCRPNPKGTVLGGFESWSQTMGGILAYSEIDGFLENLEEMYQTADEDGAQWEAFLSMIGNTFKDGSFTAADLCERMATHSALREALPSTISSAVNTKNPASLSTCLGHAFRKRTGTRYGEQGWHLERAGKSHSATKWAVLRQEGGGGEVSK
jgi:hypothetical protein